MHLRVEAELSEPSRANLKGEIPNLAKQVDSDFAAGKITSQAYALVKYNVQHLLPDK